MPDTGQALNLVEYKINQPATDCPYRAHAMSQLRFNPAQLRAIIHPVKVGVHLWGRGTGKSFGPMGWESQLVAHQMPRGTFSFVGPTYVDLMTNTLPTTIQAWKELGFQEYDPKSKRGHFCIGVKPPSHWPKPYQQPLRYDSFISWYTGAGFQLVSQDREGKDRGGSRDGIFADEGLKLNHSRFESESLSTNRGNGHHFGDNPRHHLVRITSSKPIGTGGQWLLAFGEYYGEDGHDYERLHNLVADLQLEAIDTTDIAHRRALLKETHRLRRQIHYYPKEGVYYTEANAFHNLANLGWDYLLTLRRTMSLHTFQTEVLNKTISGIDQGFYALLQERVHTYTKSYNYSYLEEHGYQLATMDDKDARIQADVLPDQPLRIGQDWGGSINYMVVGQDQVDGQRRVLRIPKIFYVKHPRILDDVFREFCQYFRHHRRKLVYFHYDHTGDNRQANSQLTFADQAEAILRDNGWTVVRQVNHQLAANPEERYYLWGRILKEDDEALPILRINANECRDLITSMQLTPLIQGTRGFKKDKRSERRTDVPQEIATHGGDALDTILSGVASLKPKEHALGSFMV